MEEKIKLVHGNETEGTVDMVNKSKAIQTILELFETKDIKKIDITYI